MTTDLVPYRHEAGPALTVGALRRAVADLDDDVVVMAYVSDEPWSGRSTGYFAEGEVELRPATRAIGKRSLALRCGPRPGTLMRPRPGSLMVGHGAIHESAADVLRQTVHDAVSATGYRGRHNEASPGSVTTWDWESHGDVEVAVVVAAAAATRPTSTPEHGWSGRRSADGDLPPRPGVP